MSKDVSFCKLRKNKILSDNFNKWTKENNYNILQITPIQRTYEDYLVTNISLTNFNFSMNNTEVDKSYTVKLYETDKNIEIPAGEYYIYFYVYNADVTPYFTSADSELAVSTTEPEAAINIIFENNHINISSQVETHVTFDNPTHFYNFEFINTTTQNISGTFRGFFMLTSKKLNLGIGDATNHPNLFNPYVGEIPKITVETGHCEIELPPFGLRTNLSEINSIYPSADCLFGDTTSSSAISSRLKFCVDYYNIYDSIASSMGSNISTFEFDIYSAHNTHVETQLENYSPTTATYDITSLYDLNIEFEKFLKLLNISETHIANLVNNYSLIDKVKGIDTGYLFYNTYEGANVITYPTLATFGNSNDFNVVQYPNRIRTVFVTKSLLNYYYATMFSSNTEQEWDGTLESAFYTILTKVHYSSCTCFALCYVNPVPVYGDKNEA